MLRRGFIGLAPAALLQAQDDWKWDVPFVATPTAVIDSMLRLAKVNQGDTLYDLGCGDGAIVISAAKRYSARCVGIDIDPERIREATENARAAGVSNRVTFLEQDLFQADIRPASVVTLYLLTSVNERLKPKLLKELKRGTRVVSHQFGMGDWKPVKKASKGGRNVMLWVVP
ncbi:MAG: methyltransferase domain-containing protein [Acidobacteria bacterium]|nr:methyltransferase domain-containing protein [Acidobacteriota bacterium]